MPPAGAESHDLQSALFREMSDVVDYTTPKGFATKAAKSRWLERVPPVLFFMIQRVFYNAEKKDLEKLDAPLTFEKDIFLDRLHLSLSRSLPPQRHSG